MSELTLTEFLLARIAEDEAAARSGQHWRYRQYGQRMGGEVYHGSALIAEDWVGTGFYGWSEHIARHDPARVLAACDAKRAIVEAALGAWSADYVEQRLADNQGPSVLVDDETGEQLVVSEWTPARILRALATPYAQHPDYRAEWTLAR